ncbi:DUF4870 domain-containing protein [Pseudoclavibacter sp. VKM Ac-2867]|uniref:DUF7822 domain-containing protein n=1 Tax=Pseudoclavibacter sp. VKM Ac-2867 TaxID=2783829 RepID=UPI00188AEE88|nr:DUF4870 domain-containing protein [Pseudoclavibacter sp. VKM Ac-2867]MBF4458766.1 DUF4870 domain-containing protein [Pseudoclavibacter sp. VKM Ac-2867]
MANRSYLYVVDEVPGQGAPLTRVSGLSEWNWDVPLLHELLVSGSGRLVPSTIWDAPAAAILGDYDQGVANLERLFARLPQDQETQRQIAEARSVLGDPANRGRYLLLEVAEIHVLSATDDENPHPEMLREAQGMVRDTEQHVDALIGAALELPPEKLPELTGSGAWASSLYFEPSGEQQPPVQAAPNAPATIPPSHSGPPTSPNAPQFGPPTGAAASPVFLARPLANGATQWSLGLIAVIPFPFVTAITAGIVMIAAGRSRAPATEAGERNRTNAANWGLTYLLSSIILIALHIAFLFVLDDTYSGSFFPIGIPITLWFAVSVTHIVFSIVGSVKASRGVVFAPIALPFFGPRLRG